MAKESPKKRGNRPLCRACKKAPAKKGNRGCCGKCYMAAYRRVKAGTYTWDYLEKLGLIAPLCRKNPTDFDLAVAAKTASHPAPLAARCG